MNLELTAEMRARKRERQAALWYDRLDGIVEWLAFARWRRMLWALVRGERLLEVGVGTGRNLAYYPPGARVTAIDINEARLERARERADKLGLTPDLQQMDAQRLLLPRGVYDGALATFVFCGVPDALQGLRELRRVVKPGGRLVLLEHVRGSHWLFGRLMDRINRATAPHGEFFNRDTVGNVRQAGWEIEQVRDLGPGGIVKLIVAQAPG